MKKYKKAEHKGAARRKDSSRLKNNDWITSSMPGLVRRTAEAGAKIGPGC